MLKVLDLFSGIGGFTLGLDSTGGFETIAFVEKDKFCQKVLKKNFPNITIEGEIRDVKGDRYKADVITGGFPCQPFSVAGKRKGTDDDRYLWDETIRVIRECKPKWFIGENVEGLINIQEGMVLRQVQTDLEKEGFEVQCLIIPASGIGAWHQRKRVWIIGCNVSNSKIIRSGESRNINQEEGMESSSSTQSDSICSNVSNTNKGLRRRWGAIRKSRTNEIWGFHSEKEEQPKQNFRSKTIRCDAVSGKTKDVPNSNKLRTQVQTKRQHTSIKMSGSSGKKNWWETESRICGVPNGVSYGMDKDRANRIKALGNSIVPQIARELGLAILDAENL